MKRARGIAIALLVPVPVAAQDLVYDATITERCLAGAETSDERLACSGQAADACIGATPGGSSTVGTGGCLTKEAAWWDTRLNQVYGRVMAQARTSDAEMKELGSHAPSQAEALRDMQRAWIAFRDGKCSYEATLWQGGTGAGPAFAACLMHTTAQQVIFLESAADW